VSPREEERHQTFHSLREAMQVLRDTIERRPARLLEFCAELQREESAREDRRQDAASRSNTRQEGDL
jgi:hypothetical protein